MVIVMMNMPMHLLSKVKQISYSQLHNTLIKENVYLNSNSTMACTQCFKSSSKSCILDESVYLNLTSNVLEKHLNSVFESELSELQIIWLQTFCFLSSTLKVPYQCSRSLLQPVRTQRHHCWCKPTTRVVLLIVERDLKKSTNMTKN